MFINLAKNLKSVFRRRNLKALVSVTVASLLTLQPITLAYAHDPGRTPEAANPGSNDAPLFRSIPSDFAGEAGQELWTYAIDQNGQEVVVKRESLNRIDIRRDPVVVKDWSTTRFVYDAEKKALLLQRLVRNDALGRDVVQYAHVIYGLDLSNPSLNVNERLARSVKSDGNVILISTTKGLAAMHVSAMREVAFNAPIRRFFISPAPSVATPGAYVYQVRFATEGDSGYEMSNRNGTRPSIARVEDVLLDVMLPNNQLETVRLDMSQEVALPLGIMELGHLVNLLIASGDPELAKDLFSIIDDPKQWQALKEYSRIQASLIAPQNVADTEHSDLLDAVTRHVALKFKPQGRMRALKPSPRTGRNAFESLAAAPRDFVPVNKGQGVRPIEAFKEPIPEAQTIEELAERIEPATPSDQSYTDKVIEATNNPKPTVKQAMQAGRILLKRATFRFAGRVNQTLTKTLARSKTFVANNNGLIKALAAAVAVDVANMAVDGAITRESLTFVGQMFGYIGEMFEWTRHIPVVTELAQKIATPQAFDYFQEKFSLTRMVVGTSIILSFRPLGYKLAQFVARRQGHKDWDQEEAFFNIGTDLYAITSFPPQYKYWVNLRNQKNLYRGLENSIPRTHPLLRNSSKATPEEIDRNAVELNGYLEKRSIANSRALLMAAAIVSKEAATSGKPMDPGTLLQLFVANRASKFDFVIESFGSDKSRAESQLAFELATTALAQLDDKGSGPLDQEAIVAYHNELVKIHDRVYASAINDKKSARVGQYVTARWYDFVTFTNTEVVNYLAYGTAGLEVYRGFKGLRISKRDKETAAMNLNVDYDASSWWFMSTAPNYFGAIGSMVVGDFSHLPQAVEVITTQAEQPAIYGIQGGVDTITTNNQDYGYTLNGFQSKYATNIDRNKSAAQGGFGRQITMREALGPIASVFLNPDDPAHVFKVWKIKMANTFTGFNARFLAGVVFRAIGLAAIGLAGGEAAGAVGGAIAKSIPQQANVMVNKISFLGNAPGYATVWALVLAIMNSVKNVIEANAEDLHTADFQIMTGVSFNQPHMVIDGIMRMQNLFKRGKVELPSELQVDVSKGGIEQTKLYELGYAIEAYAQTHPPVPTLRNKGLEEGLNIFGAATSTAMVTVLAHLMFHPDTNIFLEFFRSLTAFGMTYGGLSIALDLGPKLKASTTSAVSSANSSLSGVKSTLGRAKSAIVETCSRFFTDK